MCFCLSQFVNHRLQSISNDKTNKKAVCPAKTQISLGPVWSESSLSAWRKLVSLATPWAHSEDTDQTGRMPSLIWIFAGRTCHFVVFVTRRLICKETLSRKSHEETRQAYANNFAWFEVLLSVHTIKVRGWSLNLLALFLGRLRLYQWLTSTKSTYFCQ